MAFALTFVLAIAFESSTSALFMNALVWTDACACEKLMEFCVCVEGNSLFLRVVDDGTVLFPE